MMLMVCIDVYTYMLCMYVYGIYVYVCVYVVCGVWGVWSAVWGLRFTGIFLGCVCEPHITNMLLKY